MPTRRRDCANYNQTVCNLAQEGQAASCGTEPHPSAPWPTSSDGPCSSPDSGLIFLCSGAGRPFFKGPNPEVCVVRTVSRLSECRKTNSKCFPHLLTRQQSTQKIFVSECWWGVLPTTKRAVCPAADTAGCPPHDSDTIYLETALEPEVEGSVPPDCPSSGTSCESRPQEFLTNRLQAGVLTTHSD